MIHAHKKHPSRKGTSDCTRGSTQIRFLPANYLKLKSSHLRDYILRQHGNNGHEPAVLTVPQLLSSTRSISGVHNRSYKGVNRKPDTGGTCSLVSSL